MNKEELIKLIEDLKISKENFIILSSSALILRGIIDKAGDLDIAVTEDGFNELKENYNLIPKYNGWYIVNDRVDCILDDMEGKKELVDGYYLQDINNYLEYLESSDREKDKKRILLIKEYFKRR